MALRQIRTNDDPILRKTCKPVKEVTPRTLQLIEDMFETMYEAPGVGLAAPQVGILKNIFVIDVSGPDDEPDPLVFINPEIIWAEGEEEDTEGCLSVPMKAGKVKRAARVKVRAFDENLDEFELEADGLLARCIQHENDHLYGILYTDKATDIVTADHEDDEEGAED